MDRRYGTRFLNLDEKRKARTGGRVGWREFDIKARFTKFSGNDFMRHAEWGSVRPARGKYRDSDSHRNFFCSSTSRSSNRVG